jgi:hypothetical protein
MSRRAAARIAWSIVAFVAAVPVLVVAVAVPVDEKLEGDLLVLVFVSLFALVSVVVGALVVSRHPSNAMGWLFTVGGGLAAFSLPRSLPGPLADYPEIESPIAIGDVPAEALERAGFLLAAFAFAASTASVVYRYRRSGEVVRQQIKCLAAAAVFLAVCVPVGVTATLLGARALGARLGEQTDIETLAIEIDGVVGETVAPAHQSLWIRRTS